MAAYDAPRAVRSYFDGKNVWIIGAGSGIGAEIARQLSVCQPRLLLSSRDERRLNRVTDDCRKNGAQCDVLPVDLAQPAAYRALFEGAHASSNGAHRRLSEIDCVICAAAVSQRAPFVDMEPDTIDAILQTDIISYITIAHRMARQFIDRGGGHIVFIGSLAGVVSTPLRSVYSASKAALHSIAETLALEAAASGTKIQLVVPGFVRTSISLNALRADGSRQQIMDANQRRGMTAQRCAAKIVRFLVSDSFRLTVGLGLRGRISLLLRAICPALLRRILKRAAVT